MKKLGLLLVAILAMSMMAIIAAPALAARTPKANQVIVKVVDTAGKSVGGANVLLYDTNSWATHTVSTSWVTAKGSGTAVISLIDNTPIGTWSSATTFSVQVMVNYVVYEFHGKTLSSTFSASIEVTVPI